MLTRRGFGLFAAASCIMGLAGCSDTRDATDAGDEGIGAAGKPSDQPEMDPNEAYEAQVKRDAEAAKKRK